MNHPLIFTERNVLPRLVDSLLTLMAWTGFIWLIYHGVVSGLHMQSKVGALPFSLTFDTVSLYLLLVLFNSLFLILWAKYNQRRFRIERRTRRQALTDGQLAIHFGFTPDILEQLSQSQIVVVNYNHDGTALDVSVKRPLPVISSRQVIVSTVKSGNLK